MKGTLVVAAALAAFVSTTPAFADPKSAEPTATPETTGAPAAEQPKATRYCFDVEGTGSRLSKRVCQTREKWAREGVDVPVKR